MGDDNRVYAVPDTVIFKNWMKAKPDEIMTRRLLLRNGSAKTPFRVKLELPRSDKFRIKGVTASQIETGYIFAEIEPNGTAAFTVEFRRLKKEEDLSPHGNWQDFLTACHSGKKFDIPILAIRKGETANLETFVPERRELDKLLPAGSAAPDSRLQNILAGAISPPKVMVDEEAFETVEQSMDPVENELASAAEMNRLRHAEREPPMSPLRESAEFRRSQQSTVTTKDLEGDQEGDGEYDFYKNLLVDQVKKLRGLPGEEASLEWAKGTNGTAKSDGFNPQQEGIVFKRVEAIEEEEEEKRDVGGYGLSLSDDEERLMADMKVPGVAKPKKRTKSPLKVDIASPPRGPQSGKAATLKSPAGLKSPVRPSVQNTERARSSPRVKKTRAAAEPPSMILGGDAPIKDITPSVDPMAAPVFVINGIVCDSRGREIGSVNGDVTVTPMNQSGPQKRPAPKTKSLPSRVSALPAATAKKVNTLDNPMPLNPKEHMYAEQYFDRKIQEKMPSRLIHKEVVKVAKKPPVAASDRQWDAISDGALRTMSDADRSGTASLTASGRSTPRSGTVTPNSHASSVGSETRRKMEEDMRKKEEDFRREKEDMMNRIKELEMKVAQDQQELDELDMEPPLSAVEQAKTELVFQADLERPPPRHSLSYNIDDDDDDDELDQQALMEEYQRRVDEARTQSGNGTLKRESSIPTLPPVRPNGDSGMSNRSNSGTVSPVSSVGSRRTTKTQASVDRLSRPTMIQRIRRESSRNSELEEPSPPPLVKKTTKLNAIERQLQDNWDSLG